MNKPFDTVVFDLGGVMIDWNPRHLYQDIFRNHAEMEFFLKAVCNDVWNHQQDAGRPFQEGVDELVALYPLYEPEIRAYWERWEEMLGEANGPMIDLQQKFLAAEGYNVYALTNWSAETMPIATERYAFLHNFDGMVVSGEEKCAKPDEKIFEILLERFQLTAEKTVFIDDSLKNVDTARKMGIQAIHFRKNEQVLSELDRLDALPEVVKS